MTAALPPVSTTPAAVAAWSRSLQGPDYRWLLPALGALPAPMAYALAAWRGRFNAQHDRDWVSLALGHRHVADQTRHAYAQWCRAEAIDMLVSQRFETASREEMDARLLARRGLGAFRIDNRDALARMASRPSGRGLVMVTAHFDTFVLAIAALAAAGEVVHPVMSSVSADPRLHPAVRDHFAIKYAGLQAHLNGGRLADAETQMRHFYKALGRGEVVVVIADAPAVAADGSDLWLPWLGRERRFAQGALRLAQHSGAWLGGFVGLTEAPRQHRVIVSDLVDAQTMPTETVARTAFALLEQHIQDQPGRWWGAHLLGTFDHRPLALERAQTP
jgi:lauroyl/myristoyl acyltransferase